MTQTTIVSPAKAHWSAVWATSLGVSSLTAAEMLPVSLLSPMAHDLGISEGLAGQTVTATALVALLTSLFIAVATGRTDRRVVLLWLSFAQVVSNLMVAFAPNPAVLIVGRMLLGLSLGGFWSLSAALAMRLVPLSMVPKAFSLIFGGVSIATVTAAPIGSYLGSVIGWRGVFELAAGLAMTGFVWQFISLPGMPSQGKARLGTLLHVLKRPGISLGMTIVVLVFAGHFSFFTYLRPFLENVTQVSVDGVTAILLAFGLGSFAGTWASSRLLKRNLKLTLGLIPLLMAILTAVAISAGQFVTPMVVVTALWGFCFGTIPVGWSTWLTRSVSDEAEAGGGVFVAAIQIGMTIGPAVGGLILDTRGVVAVFWASGLVLLIATILVITKLNVSNSAPIE